MNIYLIRHGDAEPLSANKSDYERTLTPKGKESLKTAAEGWKKVISSFDVIASSPLVRAKQTSEVIAQVFKYKKEIITDKRLTSGSRPEDLIDLVRSLNGDNIALVGHEPDMSNNLSALVSSGGMYAEFRKGSIAKVNFEGRIRESAGTLKFLIPLEFFE